MKFNLPAAAFAAVILASGSAYAKDKLEPLSVPAESLKGGTVTYVQRLRDPGFMLMTPAHGAFAMVGAIAAIGQSRAFYQEHTLFDPSDLMAQRLIEVLSDQFGMTSTGQVAASDKKQVYKDLAAQGGGARYVLDVQTRGMGYIYMPVNWNSYQLTYIAAFQLIDTQDGAKGKVIASGTCTPERDNAKAAPGIGDLTDNDAAMMKAKFNWVVDECVSRFSTNVLKARAPAPKLEVAAVAAPAAPTTAPALAPELPTNPAPAAEKSAPALAQPEAAQAPPPAA